MTHKQTSNWVNILDNLILHYNNTPHSSLKAPGQSALTPNESAKMETDTRNIHIHTKDKAEGVKKHKTFEIGDHVRILKRKRVFDRGYEVRYSIAVFQIVKQEGLWYVLNDGRKFREGSLQKIKAPIATDQPEIKDVAKESKQAHRVDQLLTHKEGIQQTNRRVGLRERKPQNQVEDALYGQINW